MRPIGLALIFAVFLGCGGGMRQGTDVSITLRGAQLGSASAGIFTLRLTISAPDIAAIGQVFDIGDKSEVTTEPINVPNGLDRLFRVEVLDADGNILYAGETYADLSGLPESVAITLLPVDTDAPSTPGGLAVSNAVSLMADSSVIGLSWTASTDNTNVTGYNIYRGDTLIGSTEATSFSDTGVLPSLNYCYRVAAYDWVGNLSPDTTPLCVNTPSFIAAMSWGDNYNGQLGDGTPPSVSESSNIPVYVSGMTDTIAVSAGGSHSLAVKLDGTVWAWGDNSNGQLGDGTTVEKNVPVQVPGLSDVTAVSAGGRHSLALRSDGTVWAWGRNASGQLGDASTTDRYSPVQVATGVYALAAGANHSLAIKSDGSIWAWGRNDKGQLGDGTVVDRNSPVAVSVSGVFKAVAAGEFHSLALKSGDGFVWAWGYNNVGQLGLGESVAETATPAQVPQLYGKDTIAAGQSHSIATSGRYFWTLGHNASGQLGDGTLDNRFTPLPYGLDVGGTGGVHLVSVLGGMSHTIALRSDGYVFSWGANYYGQLGDGTYVDSLPLRQPNIPYTIAISAGSDHNLAIVLIDNFAPATPSGPNISGQVVSWGAVTDDIRVRGYKLYKNGSPIDVLGTSYTDAGSQSGDCYKVSAYDLRGNESGASPEVCR